MSSLRQCCKLGRCGGGGGSHEDFGRASIRLLLDRAFEYRQGRRPDRNHDQRFVRFPRQQALLREKAALHYTDLFKQGEHAIDKDEVYAELATHFNDEGIIELGLFCAETDGVVKFVKSLNVVSWEEACELNPRLSGETAQVAAE
jgi:hypothetical protein